MSATRRTRPHPMLNSEAARDVKWYFLCAASEMGLHARAMERGTGGGTSALDKTWRTQRALDAVVRERRIRLGMARLTHEHQAILRVAYEGRVLSKELREALGDFCDLALRMPSVDVAYDHYLANWKPTKRIPNPYGRETWLVIAAKHGSDLLPRLRNEVEAAVAAALTAFAAVVDPVAQEEAPPRVRATRAPRRDGGPPFMFDEPGKERS